jgi:hypothetical protein
MIIGVSPVPTSPVSQTGRSLVPASQLDTSHHVSDLPVWAVASACGGGPGLSLVRVRCRSQGRNRPRAARRPGARTETGAQPERLSSKPEINSNANRVASLKEHLLPGLDDELPRMVSESVAKSRNTSPTAAIATRCRLGMGIQRRRLLRTLLQSTWRPCSS